jgi:hypothetical protein
VYGTIAAEVVAHRVLLLDWLLSPERGDDEPTSSLLVAKEFIKVSGREGRNGNELRGGLVRLFSKRKRNVYVRL